MLERLLEAEAMDTPEEAAEYDAMDFAAVNSRFVADFLAAHGPCRGGEVLDVGTGTARIPIALAMADTLATILGVDLADAMLDLARRNVAAAGLQGRVALEPVDAKGLPYVDGRFEAVISNTIVHHVPDPASALDEMARVLTPGGTLFVRDLYRPDDEATLDRLVADHAGGESLAARTLFADSLHAALTVDEVRQIVEGRGTVAMTSDRHWTWTWRRPAR